MEKTLKKHYLIKSSILNMILSPFLVAAIAICLMHPLSNGTEINLIQGYVCDTIFEVSPEVEPYNFHIGLGFPAPWEKPKNIIECPTSVALSVVDNEGNLLLSGYGGNPVIKIDIHKQKLLKFYPKVGEYVNPGRLVVGPNDELYISLAKIEEHSGIIKSRLVTRFYEKDDTYIQDPKFLLEDSEKPRINIDIMSVSADSTIFLRYWGELRGDKQVNYFGQTLGASSEIGRTPSGLDIFVEEGRVRGSQSAIRGIDSKSKATVYQTNIDFPEIRPFNIMGITNDNRLMLKEIQYEKIQLSEDKYLEIRTTPVTICDFDNRVVTVIPSSVYRRSDYAYYTVDGQASNFKGDIYVMVIYFNVPGQITSDEKIVLYRWRKG